MNLEELKTQIRTILELKASFERNLYLYNNIRRYLETVDYFNVPPFINTHTLMPISSDKMLNLLLDMPTSKKVSYRDDILIAKDALLALQEANTSMLGVISDFRQNIFKYFVQKTRAVTSFSPNSFVYVLEGDYNYIIIGELKGSIFECKSYSIEISNSNTKEEYEILEYSSTKNIKIGKAYSESRDYDYNRFIVGIIAWQKIYEPEEYL